MYSKFVRSLFPDNLPATQVGGPRIVYLTIVSLSFFSAGGFLFPPMSCSLDFGQAAFLFFFCWIVQAIISWVIGWMRHTKKWFPELEHQHDAIMPDAKELFWSLHRSSELDVFIYVNLAMLSEEILFRGWIQSNFGILFAILISTASHPARIPDHYFYRASSMAVLSFLAWMSDGLLLPAIYSMSGTLLCLLLIRGLYLAKDLSPEELLDFIINEMNKPFEEENDE